MRHTLIAVIVTCLLAACSVIPGSPDSPCNLIANPTEASYCHARMELNTLAAANNQTLRDLLATNPSPTDEAQARANHRKVHNVVIQADALLDEARRIMDGLQNGDAGGKVSAAKLLILEIL